MSRITLYGFYKYDETLLDGVKLPVGLSNDIMKDEIILNCGDLYPYIQQPYMLKKNISNWFKRREFDFTQMLSAVTAEYSPIENYNRFEDLIKDVSGNITESVDSKVNSTENSQGQSSSNNSSSGSNVKQVVGYNSDKWEDREKDITNENGQTSSNGSNQTTSSNTGDTDREQNETLKETNSNHIHGNIGVTTNQQMIEAEIEMRKKYDLYKLIREMFEYEFIVQIY